jgi:capsular polysaccharide transport system permease protein
MSILKPSLLKKVDRLFACTVLVPTTVALLYFGGVASDVYVSESRFVVSSPERTSTSGLGALLLKGTGFGRAQDDAYAVQNYIQSRDALTVLNQELGLREAFSDRSVDFVNRFGFGDFDRSFEALHRYYQNKIVGLNHDSASGISTLTVRGYSAEQAQRINQILLTQSETLVNRLNDRGRQDLIRFASAEVDLAQDKAKAAALALSSFRNRQGVIDPERQSTLQLQQIAKLQDELLSNKAQLNQLQTFTKNNPQIPALQQRVRTLEAEIGKESSKVAGAGQGSLAGKAADYQRLLLEREFADKQLASAMASLEAARNEAQRKQLYLERIVQPSLPDKAQEPRRLRGVLATFILGLIAWGILSMLIAGVKEHQD